MLAKWAVGGMADVYLARQQGAGGFDKLVALKFLRVRSDEDDGLEGMFLAEARTAALLSHPNIVHTFDVGALADRPYIAMELVHGETLGRFSRKVREVLGDFPVALAVAITRDLAHALEYAHTLSDLDGRPLHLVHRDVSPSNVMVSFEGAVKLLDFGIARVANSAQTTRAGVLKGKFSYMSPEQASGEPVDHRSDIYSLALVMWQLLTGEQAYHAESELEMIKMVGRGEIAPPSQAGARSVPKLDAIVMRALDSNPADRYQRAGAFGDALNGYLVRNSPGLDAGKVIRGFLGQHFAAQKERLATAVRGGGDGFDMASSAVDFMMTPTAARAWVDGSTGGGSRGAFAVGSQTVAEAADPRRGRRRRAVALAATVTALAAAGLFLVRSQRAAVHGAGGSELALATNDARPDPARTASPAELASPAAEDAAARPPPGAADGAPPAIVAGLKRPAEKSPAPRPARNLRSIPPPVRSTPDAGARHEEKRTRTSAPADASVAPATPRPPPPAPAPRPPTAVTPPPRAPAAIQPGSLDAAPSLVKVAVDGPLPSSELESAIGRVSDQFRGCYRAAARKAGRTPALTVKISFVIDEGRAARSAHVSGDTLGVGSCMKAAIAKIRTRVAPDVGTAAVSGLVRFTPTR